MTRPHTRSPWRDAHDRLATLLEAAVSRSNGRGETGRASVTLKEIKVGTGPDAKLELQIEVTASAITTDGEDSPFDGGTSAFRAGQEAQVEYDRLRAVYPLNGAFLWESFNELCGWGRDQDHIDGSYVRLVDETTLDSEPAPSRLPEEQQ